MDILHTENCSRRFAQAELIAKIGLQKDPDCPRCRLELAAPDLLEACQLSKKMICGEIYAIDPENTIVLRKLTLAIAKAEGRI